MALSAAPALSAPLNWRTSTVSFFAFFPLPTLIVSTCNDSTVTSGGGVGSAVAAALSAITVVVACGAVGVGWTRPTLSVATL